MSKNEECKRWIYNRNGLRKTFFQKKQSAYFLPFAGQQSRFAQLPWGIGTMSLFWQRSRKIYSQPRNCLIRKRCSLTYPWIHSIPVSHYLYCRLVRAPRHLSSPHPNRWDFREPGKPRQSFDFYVSWQKTSIHTSFPTYPSGLLLLSFC